MVTRFFMGIPLNLWDENCKKRYYPFLVITLIEQLQGEILQYAQWEYGSNIAIEFEGLCHRNRPV